MNYTKQPIDIPAQIAMLQERGMHIPDVEIARKCLGSISYFRLASYWRPMEEEHVTHRFKPGSSFMTAMSLYSFDNELRAILFRAIQQIEIALRTKMIHAFSMSSGAFWFANDSLFSNMQIYEHCLSHIRQELARSREDFIVEHRQRYSCPEFPPAWKTMEVISFGTLSKLFCNFADKRTKKSITREFGLPQHLYLESWMKAIAVLRNVCAHHARVWNRRFPVRPQLPGKLENAWITLPVPDSDKLYPILTTLAYWTDRIYPAATFKQDLVRLIEKYPIVDIAAMGIPKDWENEPLWK